MTYAVADVAGVAGEGALVQLAAVPGMDEELDRTPQGRDRAREAAGAAAQARQGVPHLGIVGLDTIRLARAGRDGVVPRVVDQRRLRREGVGVVLLGWSGPLNRLLQHLLIACRFQARLVHKPPGEEDTVEDRLSG